MFIKTFFIILILTTCFSVPAFADFDNSNEPTAINATSDPINGNYCYGWLPAKLETGNHSIGFLDSIPNDELKIEILLRLYEGTKYGALSNSGDQQAENINWTACPSGIRECVIDELKKFIPTIKNLNKKYGATRYVRDYFISKEKWIEANYFDLLLREAPNGFCTLDVLDIGAVQQSSTLASAREKCDGLTENPMKYNLCIQTAIHYCIKPNKNSLRQDVCETEMKRFQKH